MTVLDRNYSEKRDFIRMPISTVAFIQINGESEERECVCRDLSAIGMLLETSFEVKPETLLSIKLPSTTSGFSSLSAKVEVTRCADYHDNKYLIGVKIIEMK